MCLWLCVSTAAITSAPDECLVGGGIEEPQSVRDECLVGGGSEEPQSVRDECLVGGGIEEPQSVRDECPVGGGIEEPQCQRHANQHYVYENCERKKWCGDTRRVSSILLAA